MQNAYHNSNNNIENAGTYPGMVWHNILTYPVLLVLSGVFAFFAVKSVWGIVNAEYAFLNGCDFKESIDSSVSLAQYMYGDDFSFALADIFARVISGILAVWGIITAILLSDKKRKALPSLTGYMILLLIFNVGYAAYRYIDVGICDFFNPAGS